MSRKRRTILWIVGAWLFISLAMAPFMLSAWRQKRLFDKTFARYSSALIHKDFVRAYALCGPDFRRSVAFSEFVRQQASLEGAYGELSSIKQGSTVVERQGSPQEWAAVVHAELVYARNAAMFVYEFHLDGAEWKLYGYKQQK